MSKADIFYGLLIIDIKHIANLHGFSFTAISSTSKPGASPLADDHSRGANDGQQYEQGSCDESSEDHGHGLAGGRVQHFFRGFIVEVMVFV